MNPITAPELLRNAAEILENADTTLFVVEGIAYAAGMTKAEYQSVYGSAECGHRPETVLRRVANVLDDLGCTTPDLAAAYRQQSLYEDAIKVLSATRDNVCHYMRAYSEFCAGGVDEETLKAYDRDLVSPANRNYLAQVRLVAKVFDVPEEEVYDKVLEAAYGCSPELAQEKQSEPERKEPSEILREVIERYAEQTLKEDEVEDESYICVGELETLSEAVKAYYEVAR